MLNRTFVVVAVSDVDYHGHCLGQSATISGHHHHVVTILPFPVCLFGHHTHTACLRVNPETGEE